MNKPFPRPDKENDFESLAHDLLGVDLNASDDEDDPLEVEGLGLDDLGFGTPAPPETPRESQPSADEPAPDAEVTPPQAKDDSLDWLVATSKKSTATASVNPPPDEDDDFGFGLGDDELLPLTTPPAAGARKDDEVRTPKESAKAIEDDISEEETVEDATESKLDAARSDADDYWDALEDWADWEGGADDAQARRTDRSGRPSRRDRGKPAPGTQKPRSPRAESDSRDERPERRKRNESRNRGREEPAADSERKRGRPSTAAREKPQPILEDLDDEFGEGIWGEVDSPEIPDDDWSNVDEDASEDVIPQDSIDDDDDDDDDVFGAEEPDDDDELLAEAGDEEDDFGAGLDVEPPEPKRRRPPSRQRARESSPEGKREPERKARPRRRTEKPTTKTSSAEAGTDETVAARKSKYDNIPTWEEAIALLSLKQPSGSGSGRRQDNKKRGRSGRGGRRK